MQNTLYIGQAACICCYELYPQLIWTHDVMSALAIIILLLEMIQICHDPKDDLSSIFNDLEVFGNGLVLLTRLPQF